MLHALAIVGCLVRGNIRPLRQDGDAILAVLKKLMQGACKPAPLNAKPRPTDRWPSGRRRTPGKCVGGRPSPGFESLSVRHFQIRSDFPSSYLTKDLLARPASGAFYRSGDHPETDAQQFLHRGIMHVTKRGHQWRLGRSMTVKFQGVEARWEIRIRSKPDFRRLATKNASAVQSEQVAVG